MKRYADPYVAGAGIGLVLLAAYWIAGRGLGASGAFASVAAASMVLVQGSEATMASPATAPYLTQGLSSPLHDWLVLELIGVALGGYVSARLAGRRLAAIERGGRVSAGAADDRRGRRRRADGARREIRARLHERPGADRRRAARRGKLDFHRHLLCGGLRPGAAGAEALAMMPLTETGALGATGALLAALALGFAFGWCLEQGGLGSARKLAGQFYFTDLTVFKVMFSALVTAMLGAFWLDRFDLLDLNLVYLPETFVLPQAIGGALFGAGFLVAGLCPGTVVRRRGRGAPRRPGGRRRAPARRAALQRRVSADRRSL